MIQVILLCAGYATRLYPLTKNQPKPLLPVGQRPILEYALDRIQSVEGVEKILIVTNHQFARHFEKWREGVRYPWPIEVIDDLTTSNDNRRGAIGDLAYVLETKRIVNDDLLIIAGDNLFDFDLRLFVEFSKAKKPHSVIAAFDVKNLELAKQYGILKIDKNSRVEEFLEKPQNPPSSLASCGIYWLPAETRVLLDRYLHEGHNADQPGHYMRWLAQTDDLFAFPLEGIWYDIGDLNSYRKADAQFSGISKS
ncbi:MAG TPA: nucleotidyltransferase family protein [bacterium]|nr:nucleotidyltransferase family protein [bacterium]